VGCRAVVAHRSGGDRDLDDEHANGHGEVARPQPAQDAIADVVHMPTITPSGGVVIGRPTQP
jgi:hypothetical protein